MIEPQAHTDTPPAPPFRPTPRQRRVVWRGLCHEIPHEPPNQTPHLPPGARAGRHAAQRLRGHHEIPDRPHPTRHRQRGPGQRHGRPVLRVSAYPGQEPAKAGHQPPATKPAAPATKGPAAAPAASTARKTPTQADCDVAGQVLSRYATVKKLSNGRYLMASERFPKNTWTISASWYAQVGSPKVGDVACFEYE